MTIRALTSLFAAAAAAASLSVATALPATAESTPAVSSDVSTTAECIGPWQRNSVGSNRAMETCITGVGFGTFTAKTAVISTSFWTGYHGCVRREFLNAQGTVIHRSTEHRWGVNAGHTRILDWSGTAPTDFYTSRFVHWRC